METAQSAYKKMNGTFRTYQRIYPGIFKREAQKELSKLLNEGLIINGSVNNRFLDPDNIESLIKAL